MTKILLLLLGGAIGTLARFGLSGLVYKYSTSIFPWGTLAVNLSGSLIIGIVWGLWESVEVPLSMRIFILIGILGGFTTFSTFSIETLNLVKAGEVKYAIFNVLASNVLGLLLVWLGYLGGREIMGFGQ